MNQCRSRTPRLEAGLLDGVQVRDFCPDMTDGPISSGLVTKGTSFESGGSSIHGAPVYTILDNGQCLQLTPGSTYAPVRQGRDVLGPYAFERQMPTWQKLLIKHQSGTFVGLQYGPEPEIPLLVMSNETHNTIRVLQMLSDADPSVRSFTYCHPATNHIHARRGLSNFCGYHSILMLLSYLRGCATAPKHHIYALRLPNILELQSLITEGWTAHNINRYALTETGGLLGTRKHIGTGEATTLLHLLGIPHWTIHLQTSRGARACDVLLAHASRYFTSDTNGNPLGKPPIYLQYHGHSVVIIGIETRTRRRRRSAAINGHSVALPHFDGLAVFNCARSTPDAVRKIRDGGIGAGPAKIDGCAARKALKGYRLSRNELQRYGAFDLVFLEDPRLGL